jgi:cytochrome c oxidase subunit 2
VTGTGAMRRVAAVARAAGRASTAVALLAAEMLAQPIAVAPQSALEPGGPAAKRIGDLWNLMLWLGSAVTVVVLAGLAYAIWRHRPASEVPEADRPPDARGETTNDESGGRGHTERGRPRSERTGVRVMVGAGAVFPAIVLGVLLVFVMRVLAATSLPSHVVGQPADPPREGELTVAVTGHQFWWEVQYIDRDPQRHFRTANELRIPVGRRVVVRLAAGDVIHSFWVPGLQGKMDNIPGRTNALWIEASAPGRWRGQCAEYCGVQHAKMAFVVVAVPPDEYDAWAARQREPRREPVDSASRADEATFLGSGCVLCHAVQGTPARGTLGPDLTHLASRLTLAAGTLPNTPGHLHGWIADPQAIKPGSRMPAVPMTASELHAIARYLGTLH